MFTIKHDLKELESMLGSIEKKMLPTAAVQATNRTIKTVRSVAVKQVAADTGRGQQKDIGPGITVTQATRNRIQASLYAGKLRARNVIDGVRKGQDVAGYFNARSKRGKYRAEGVKVKAWGKTKTYKHTFIGRGKTSGKMLVLARKGPGRHPLKSILGPSPRRSFDSDKTQRLMKQTARDRFRIELDYAINRQIELRKRRMTKFTIVT